jgi:hypothetical protein
MTPGTGDVVLMQFGSSAVVVIVKVTTTPLAIVRAAPLMETPAAVRHVAPDAWVDRTLGPGVKPPQ